MNAIYPMWVAAHGVMIVTPVHWYQATSPLKLMIDRLVCADGGNPDPTLTHGKDAAKSKAVELAGWDYPRHLAGRLFAVVVHGDVEGVENVARPRRLVALHASCAGRRSGGARPLHRLLGALRHQPPGARPGRGDPAGGDERSTDSCGSLGCTP
jgi:multimeric flavodoxin WrbA